MARRDEFVTSRAERILGQLMRRTPGMTNSPLPDLLGEGEMEGGKGEGGG